MLLFQDEHVLAVDKPSGEVVHASAYAGPGRDSLAREWSERLGKPVYPVHRLDRATSGVLVFSLSQETTPTLSAEFREHRAEREYVAVVRGFTPERGKIDRALEHMEKDTIQDAVTEYERLAVAEIPVPIDRYPTTRISLVRVRPHTGRMHQIRRHLRGINHPILADAQHGDGAINRVAREHLGVARLMLHALRIEFAHPVTGRRLKIEASPPPEFTQACKIFGDLAMSWAHPMVP